MNQIRGFTLLELLICLAIGSALYGIGVSSNMTSKNLQNFKLYEVAVLNVLQTARNLSRTQQCCALIKAQVDAALHC